MDEEKITSKHLKLDTYRKKENRETENRWKESVLRAMEERSPRDGN
jgi:hypothetical protein